MEILKIELPIHLALFGKCASLQIQNASLHIHLNIGYEKTVKRFGLY